MLRYRNGEKQTDLGLGSYPDVSLAMPREKALELRRTRIDGQDPLEARRATRLSSALVEARHITFQ